MTCRFSSTRMSGNKSGRSRAGTGRPCRSGARRTLREAREREPLENEQLRARIHQLEDRRRRAVESRRVGPEDAD